jgi:hypothetical protein
MADISSADVARLERTLSALEVNIGQGTDGKYTAHSNSEPLFCVVRSDIDDVRQAIEKILTSYINTFYHLKVNRVGVELIEVPVDRSAIPVETVKPISRLTPKPSFGGFLPTGPQYAVG